MISPFSFFILVMSTLLFADLIPGMFFSAVASAEFSLSFGSSFMSCFTVVVELDVIFVPLLIRRVWHVHDAIHQFHSLSPHCCSFMLPLLHILSSSSAFASAFSQIAPAAAAFSSFACAFLASLSACPAALLVVAFFCSYFLNDLLIFFRAQAPRLQCFVLLVRVHHAQSCLVFLYS